MVFWIKGLFELAVVASEVADSLLSTHEKNIALKIKNCGNFFVYLLAIVDNLWLMKNKKERKKTRKKRGGGILKQCSQLAGQYTKDVILLGWTVLHIIINYTCLR